MWRKPCQFNAYAAAPWALQTPVQKAPTWIFRPFGPDQRFHVKIGGITAWLDPDWTSVGTALAYSAQIEPGQEGATQCLVGFDKMAGLG
jgi:hypothetical protein